MRKLIYLLTFLLVLQLTVHAQNVRGGLKAGVAIAKYNGAGDGIHERSGPALGLFWDVNLNKYFSFQPTLNFWIQKGYNQTKVILNSTINATTLKVNYSEAQFNFVFHTPGKKMKLFVGGGPSAALALNGKITKRTASSVSKLDVNFGKKSTSDLKKTDFGITGLLGVSYGGFVVMGCYNHGITDLNPHDNENAIESSYIGISVAFLLPFTQTKK
jgi:hypothetical protein